MAEEEEQQQVSQVKDLTVDLVEAADQVLEPVEAELQTLDMLEELVVDPHIQMVPLAVAVEQVQ